MNGKISVSEILRMKKERRKIICVTSYDYATAALAEKAGIDFILVGDSAGMVVFGYDTTTPVTMDEMILLSRAVSRGNKHSLIVGDMPFMSYQASDEEAVRNAGRFIKEGGVDAVKIEGGRRMKSRIEAISETKIPVAAHIGLTPQTSPLWGPYRVHGRTTKDVEEILSDAEAVEEAGAFAVVLEMVTSEAAKLVTERLSIPTIGIGSGPFCDGQIIVLNDILGLYGQLKPKFVKRYAELGEEIQMALESYREDVLKGRFPSEEHTFHMKEQKSKPLSAEKAKKR
jgi:3-methyl-2-oxobutanoate hydroxymethyltransferase